MAESAHQKEAREAIEKAQKEMAKSLERIKQGHETNEHQLKKVKEHAAAWFDINGVC